MAGSPSGVPYCQVLLVCDRVTTDDKGRFTFHNVFDTVNSVGFPALHPSFTIVAVFADGLGDQQVTVRITNWHNTAKVLEITSKIGFPNRRQMSQAIINAQNVVFPTPGDYRVEVEIAGKVLMDRRLILTKI